MAHDLDLSKPPPAGAARDAVHVAVYPMVAPCVLQPGQHLQNGVVNPYLTTPVQPGERFWLFLYPLTVTGLRHVWTHPSFPDEPVKPERASRSERDAWRTAADRAAAEGVSNV